MKHKKIVIVAVSSVLALALIAGLVLGLDRVRALFGQAAGQQQPQGVRTTNITANSVTVVWQTTTPVIGQIEYGTTPGSFLLRNTGNNQTTNHSLTLSPLLPETIYYFRIRVGDQVYDNNGAPYSFTTKSLAETSQTTPLTQNQQPPQQTTLGPDLIQEEREEQEEPLRITPTPIVSPPPQNVLSEKPRKTIGDFVEKFGTSNPEFDLNKDGIVNSQDWALYQQQNP